MEKEISTFTHNISLNERKNLVVSGVKKIDNFDSNEFLIETTLGYLRVTGNDLEIVRLDTREGNVSIKGLVNGIIYNEDKKESKEGFITKLFK